MKNHSHLSFDCKDCKKPIRFSLFELEHLPDITCSHCWKKYLLDDLTLKRQLKLFCDLCRQIHESKEILSLSQIGIDVANQHVLIPFKLLLTRLTSTIELSIGDVKEKYTFRFEPTKERISHEPTRTT